MKRTIFLLAIVILCLVPVYNGRAQEEATAVESLIIDFWPDYDQTAVLVLVTGTLPTGTPTPATVALALPENAQLNAVAYRDASGLVNADYEEIDSQIVITTPNLDFHVEYYIPYEAAGSQRSFSYNWTSQLSVNQLEAKVQQPLAASTMLIEPEPLETASASDGFTYHLLPAQSIPAGQPFTLNVNYTMSSDELSVNRLSSDSGTIDLQPAGPVSTSSDTAQTIDWPIIAGIAGGVLIVAALAFIYLGNRSRPRVRKPAPARRSTSPARPTAGASRFCHNCGEAVEAGDRFCRNCGTPVKGK